MPFFDEADACAPAEPFCAGKSVGETVRHLYLHVPFCRTRCAYCDFVSTALTQPDVAFLAERYLEAVGRELEACLPLLAPSLDTVYVGGGTPTFLPDALLGRLLGLVAPLLVPGGELTVEANPGALDESTLELMAGCGANRLSLGVQSFEPRLRANLGRRVEQEEVEAAIGALQRSGLANWNLDLVFAIPGAHSADIRRDLTRAVEAGPAHISLYDLTYTAAYTGWLHARMGVAAAEAAVDRAARLADRLYEQAVAFLEERGFARYEVSNFARPGGECRHNLAYWQGEDYLGLGAGAVSTVRAERFRNPMDVEAYVAGEAPEREPLSCETRLVEKVMLGLRTTRGVNEDEVAGVLDPARLAGMLEAGVVQRRYGTLVLSHRGMNVSNSVLAAVLRLRDDRS